MLSRPLATLAASRTYLLLVFSALLVGFRDAMAEPFLILFLVDKAHLAPLPLGILLTLRAAGAVGVSMLFGAWLDRRPSLFPLMAALLLGVFGYVALATTTSYGLLLLIVAAPLAANNAVFPQLFALAKRHLDGQGTIAAEQGIAFLRATFSAAWAVGPILGAAMVGVVGYAGNFLVSAACGASALTLVILSRLRAPRKTAPPPVGERAGTSLGIGVSAAGFTLFSMAIVMGAVALPIVVTRDLHGTESDVGLAAAMCAVLEIPVMVAVALRPAALGGFNGLVMGYAALILYFIVMAWAPSVSAVLLAQGARAVAIGLVTCIGISYMQELMPGRAGAAAALFSNTGQVGALLGGLGAGEWATVFDYRSCFVACGAAGLAGLLLVALGAKPVRVGRASAA